jgi:hypothetical protein
VEEQMRQLAPHTTSQLQSQPLSQQRGLSIAIRDVAGEARGATKRWVFERLQRQLGKYASQVERVEVRFCDLNGHKGGQDQSCMVHVVLSALPPIVVESVGGTPREAFDLAAVRAERATQRNLQKHGFSTGHKRRQRPQKTDGTSDGSDKLALLDEVVSEAARSTELLLEADEPPPSGHAGRRNLTRNDSGMTYALEDSTNGHPSRKSTRGSSNHVKPANGLTLRTNSAVLSPKSIAARSASRGS